TAFDNAITGSSVGILITSEMRGLALTDNELRDLVNILVPAPRQVNDDDLILAPLMTVFRHIGNRVGGLERGENAFCSGQSVKGLQHFVVSCIVVLDPARVAKVTVLRPNCRVVETSRNGMSKLDLPIVIG